MMQIWVYAVVAVVIALSAFVVGQLLPGLGVPFAALASTIWVAYSVYREQSHLRNR
jgi:hypothetical protein